MAYTILVLVLVLMMWIMAIDRIVCVTTPLEYYVRVTRLVDQTLKLVQRFHQFINYYGKGLMNTIPVRITPPFHQLLLKNHKMTSKLLVLCGQPVLSFAVYFE